MSNEVCHKIKVTLVAITLGLSCMTPRQTKIKAESIKTIAVVDTMVHVSEARNYTLPNNVAPPDYTPVITEAVEAAFVSTGKYSVVERERLHALQHELALSLDDVWFDQKSIANIGKFKGARLLVLPTARLEIGLFSTTLSLQVKVADVETGKIIYTYSAHTTSYNPNTNISVDKCLHTIQEALSSKL